MALFSLRSVGSVAIAFVLAACSDPLGPADISGTYVLTSVGSAAPPVLVTLDDGSTRRIEADTVVLRADGTGTRRVVEQFTPHREVREGDGQVEFTYRVSGRTVHAVVDTGVSAVLITFELVVLGDDLWNDDRRYQRRGAPAP